MPVSFFGRFILEKQAVPRTAILDAIEFQKSRNLTLSAISVAQGAMTTTQADDVEVQQRISGRGFGTIAMEKKYLTQSQMGKVLKAQMEGWVFFTDALLRRGHLTRRQLEHWLHEFRKEQQVYDEDLAGEINEVPHGDVVTVLVGLAVSIFNRMVGRHARLTELKFECDAPAGYDYCFVQPLAGDRNLLFGMSVSSSLARTIAGAFVSLPEVSDRTIELECVAELVNIIVGNGCTGLSNMGINVHADPVRLYERDKSMSWPGRCVCADIECDDASFQVVLSFL